MILIKKAMRRIVCLPPGTTRENAELVSFIDGDTIEVTIDGVIQKV